MTRNFSFGACACVAITLFCANAGTAAAKEQVLYSFQGGNDGDQPYAAMVVDKAGNLYGTTSLGGGVGGSNCNYQASAGCGIVFELSPPAQKGGTWTEAVLYAFQGGNDGATPESALIADSDGNLYGTTSQGGDGACNNQGLPGCGVVFALTRPQSPGGGWTESVLYSFQGNPDGRGNGDFNWPNGIVFAKDGNLYGFAYGGGHCTTDETGTSCYGGAFELRKSDGQGAWREQVLYRFRGMSGDPAGPVFDKSGNLYGTAPGGTYGCGGVFELSPPPGRKHPWTESSVYDFRCGSDGAFPLPGLMFDAQGNLYDTSLGSGGGYGNVFELVPAQGGGWTESVLYNFTPVTTGYTPTVGPIFGADGNLFGATEGGGQHGAGVVYELAPQNGGWTESVLHSFSGGADGVAPYGGLVVGKGGAVYGTTLAGGEGTGCGNGCGTVYKVVP